VKKPAVILLVHAEGPAARHCVAMGICRHCGSRSNAELKPAVVEFLRGIWSDLREIAGIIAPAGRLNSRLAWRISRPSRKHAHPVSGGSRASS
jgi:hypothetical protein